MKRIFKCLNFELKYLGKSTLVFLGFYFGIYIVIAALILYANQHGNSGGSVNTSFFMAGAIYIFVILASSYKTLFNKLMMFGNTRRSIVFSSFIACAALSVVISVISIISILLDVSFTAVSGNSGFDVLALMYNVNANIATKLLWFLTFFILVGSFAMLFGSLAYKFGKVFISAFWIGLFFLVTLIPILTGIDGITSAFKTFFSLYDINGILLAPINFILAAVVLGAASYLSARRQPQNA